MEPVMRAILSFVVALFLVPLAFAQQPQAKGPPLP